MNRSKHHEARRKNALRETRRSLIKFYRIEKIKNHPSLSAAEKKRRIALITGKQ